MAIDLHYGGALTGDKCPTLPFDLLEALASSDSLRVHLWAVLTIDRFGVKALLDAKKAAAAAGKDLILLGGSPAVSAALLGYAGRSPGRRISAPRNFNSFWPAADT